MVRTTSKKMIPLLLLKILWNHTDTSHSITMEYICNRLEEYFEPAAKEMSRCALRKLVSSNIKQLNLLYEETDGSLDGECIVFIHEETIANPECSSGYMKVYYLEGKNFSDAVFYSLCDFILFLIDIEGRFCKKIVGNYSNN